MTDADVAPQFSLEPFLLEFFNESANFGFDSKIAFFCQSCNLFHSDGGITLSSGFTRDDFAEGLAKSACSWAATYAPIEEQLPQGLLVFTQAIEDIAAFAHGSLAVILFMS